MRDSKIPSPSTAEDILGARLANLQKQIDGITGEDGTATGSVGVPEPCTPDFAIAFEKLKGKVRAQCCALIPTGTSALTTEIIRDADCTSQANFDRELLGDKVEVDEASAGAGHIEYLFGNRLEMNTLYRLMRLIAHPPAGGKIINGSTVFTDPPLTTFTTPGLGQPPSSPSTSLIGRNRLDPSTVAYDAFVRLSVLAPLTDAGAAQSWPATNLDQLTVMLQDDDFAPPEPLKVTIQISSVDTDLDPTSTPPNRGVLKVRVPGLIPGGQYTWLRNSVWLAGERIDSTGGAVSFVGADFSRDPNNLLAVSLTLQNSDPYDGKHAQPFINFTQPTVGVPPPPRIVGLKHVTIRRRLLAEPDTAYVTVIKNYPLFDDSYHTSGAVVTIQLPTIKLKASKSYRLEATIMAVGGLTKVVTLDVGPGLDENLTADVADAGLVGNLTLAWKVKKGWNATWDEPTADYTAPRGFAVSMFHYDGVNTRWMHPETGALLATVAGDPTSVDERVAANTGGVKVFILVENPYHRTGIQAATEANAWFVTNGVKVRVRARNFQPAGKVISVNQSTSAAFVIPGVDTQTSDIAAPSGVGGAALPAPAIDWTAAGRLRVRAMIASTDIHSLKKKYLVIASDANRNSSTVYLDLVNRIGVNGLANDSTMRFEFGVKSHLILADIKKKIYNKAFVEGLPGSGGSFLAYWYAENDINISSPSTASSPLTVSALNDILSDTRDAVNVVDIGVTLTGYQNMLLNGDFLYDSGTSLEVNAWSRGTLGGTTNVITDTSADVNWQTGEHSLLWTAVTEILQGLKKRTQRNDYYSITFIAKIVGGGTFASGTVNVNVVNDDDTPCTVAGGGFNASELTSSYQLFGVTVQNNNTSDFSQNKFLRLSLSGVTLDATHKIQIDRVMMVRGRQGVSFSPRAAAYEGSPSKAMPATVGGPGSAEDHTVTPTGSSIADLAQPSGAARGGWPGAGAGGRIDYQTIP